MTTGYTAIRPLTLELQVQAAVREDAEDAAQEVGLWLVQHADQVARFIEHSSRVGHPVTVRLR